MDNSDTKIEEEAIGPLHLLKRTMYFFGENNRYSIFEYLGETLGETFGAILGATLDANFGQKKILKKRFFGIPTLDKLMIFI